MRYENEIVGREADEKPPEEWKPASGSKSHVGKSALLLLRDIGIAIGVIILVLQFVKPTIVFEHSMEDTLHPDDYVFLARQAYTFGGEVEHGDIVVFESVLMDVHGSNKNLIKRVIGIPGDIISIKDDAVYRNGERLVEPYTKDGRTSGEMEPITVPNGAYFVMGDNREVSTDTRNELVGFVPRDKIIGKVIFRLFPVSRAGRIS